MTTFFQISGIVFWLCMIAGVVISLYGYNIHFFITKVKLDKGKLKGIREGTAHLAKNRPKGKTRDTNVFPRSVEEPPTPYEGGEQT